MTVLKRLGLALASAAMLGGYASYPMLAFLPWVALVPWVLLYAGERKAPPSYAYFALAVYVGWILQYPQSWRFGWYAPFVLGLMFLPLWLPFAPLLSWVHRSARLPRSLTVALAWTTAEWLRVTFTISHFDLYGLGYSQSRFPFLVQFVDLAGVYGVTFLIAAGNGWLADWILAARETGWRRSLDRPSVKWGAIAILGAVVAASGYGAWRLGSIHHRPGPRLALVQPNLPHSENNLIEVHLEQLLMTARRVPAKEVDLVVWPENAILDDIRREGAYLDDLARLGKEKEAWFLVGALGERKERPGYTTNGAWLIDTDGEIRGEYQKQILFPWSEYIPGDRFLGRWLPGVQRFYRWIIRLGWGHQPTGTAGDHVTIMELPWNGDLVRFAPLICVENAYPPLPAAGGRLGADFFINITSEGLVGGPVQEQLLRIAILRAIENRMAYVRVGNSGISGVIDTSGRVASVLRGDNGNTINTPGVLLVDVPLADHARTPYSRSHDLFVMLVVTATAGLLLSGVTRRIRRVAAAAVILLAMGGCMTPPALDGPEERVPDNLALGRSLLDAGKPREAVEALAAACATEPGCRDSMPFLFQAYAARKSDDVAAATFAKIAVLHPALRAEAFTAQGYFLERILDLPAARDAYLASLDARPTTAAYERLGRLQMRMERPEDAVATFREGLRIEPGSPPLRYLLGRSLTFGGSLDEGELVLSDLVSDRPDQASAWTMLAWIQLRRGDEAEAESLLRKALSLQPVPAEARYLEAKLAMRRGDWPGVKQAIGELRGSR